MIVEVGPRDGLQNESKIMSTDDKVKLIHDLVDAGVQHVEVGSFVRADLVPTMADTAEVVKRLTRKPGVRYTALVPNPKGMDAAIQSGMTSVAVFTAASETFNQKNIRMSVGDSLAKIQDVIKMAAPHQIDVRGYLSTCWHCPYEGAIKPERVVALAAELIKMGCWEVSLGDTIGHATPDEVRGLLVILLKTISADRIAVHFHDTNGRALENIRVAQSLGITTIDSAVGGLGGMPLCTRCQR